MKFTNEDRNFTAFIFACCLATIVLDVLTEKRPDASVGPVAVMFGASTRRLWQFYRARKKAS